MISWQNVVISFSTSNSKIELGLQLADIISSSINQLILKISHSQSMSSYDLFNVDLLSEKENVDSWYIISDKFARKCYNNRIFRM